MVSYMGGRFVIFYHLLDSTHEQRKINMERMKNYDKEDFEKFCKWAKTTIEIGEEYLGEEYSKEFKELFNCLEGDKNDD